MLKKLFFTVLCTLSVFHSAAQQFSLDWDKRYGGSNDDAIGWFEKTNDGGLILGGTSYSNISGDKTEANKDTAMQSSDFWLVKTDDTGAKMWDKTLGGTRTDQLIKLINTADGGYLAGGITYSGVGADKSQPNWDPTEISNDYWIIKTDALGNKIWDKRYGGTTFDLFAGVRQTIDGGYIVCGTTFSDISGDVTEPTKGSWDFWVVRIDPAGNILWDKRFGGATDDFATSIDHANNGGFIIGGYSNSPVSGNKSQPSQGGWDYWVVRIDQTGNFMWDRTFGGNDSDWMFDLTQTSNGGFLLGGQSFSGANGDKSEPNHDATSSGSDRWIVRINDQGVKLWDRTYGASEIEDVSRVNETMDGGFMICGESYSGLNGDKTEANLGVEQTWILKTDSAGNIEWDKTVFSLGHDESGTAIEYDSLCFVSVNYTTADTGGYKSEPTQGNGDYWITKICQENPSSIYSPDENLSQWNLFPNPVMNELLISNEAFYAISKIEVIDLNGRILISINKSDTPVIEIISIDVSQLSAGNYFCRITSEKNQEVKKFTVED